MKKKRIFTAVLIVLLLCLLAAAAIAASIVRYAKTDETQPADCIVILGAGTWEGEVSPVFEERLRHGADLYREGYAPVIILTGGLDPRNTIPDAEAARRWMVENGIPDEAILMEEKSRYTHENFLYAKELMEENGLVTALVVSDPLHMKRAMLAAGDYGVDAWSSPTPTTRYRTARTILPFLMRETACYIGYSVWRVVGR